MTKDSTQLNVFKKEEAKLDKKKIPAVLYGPKRENISLCVDQKNFIKLYNEIGESSLINLQMDDKKISSALIYDIQRNSLTGDIVHVDFYEPNLKEKVDAEVSVVYEGESLGVKDSGGTLMKNFDTLLVRALPEKLPNEIKIDVSKLESADDVIYIKDISLPEDVEILQDEEAVVAMISQPENVDEELEKPIEEGEEPEVVGEKEEKDEEESSEVEGEEDKKEE